MIKRIRIIQFIIRTIIAFIFLTLMFVFDDKLTTLELAIFVVLPGVIILTINWVIFEIILSKKEKSK